MRGFPLVNLILSLLVCGLVILPLVKRTSVVAAPTLSEPVQLPVGRIVPSLISLRFVHEPQLVQLIEAGNVLRTWSNASLGTEFTESLPLTINEGRSEFSIRITWPANTPDTMAELKVEPDSMPPWSGNVWSHGLEVEEVINIPWPN